MTDTLGQSQVLPYICGLSKHGYSYTLISCEKPEKFEKNKSPIDKICKENNIDWQPIVYHKSPPIVSTIWDIVQIQKKANKLHQTKSFQLVHCRGYISAIIGFNMKKKFNIKFLFDMRGLWADEKVDAGAWDISKPHYRFVYTYFKKKEKEFFLNADHTVSLTHAGKKEILSWNYMQNRQDNIAIIPCCADTDLFDFNAINEKNKITWKSKLKIKEGEFILSYLGSIGTWYMLDEMLDFFVEFKKSKPQTRFLFITHDEHERIIKSASDRDVLQDIIIQPAQRDEVATILSLSDLSIFFIRATYSKQSSSPTKKGEIMALGIPIICNSGVGDTDTIVKNYNSGLVINEFSTANYNHVIEKYKTESFEPTLIRNGAIEYFSLEKGVKSYLEIYSKLLN
jgi:glycosyltransferase involved in cell wall biosynthesis